MCVGGGEWDLDRIKTCAAVLRSSERGGRPEKEAVVEGAKMGQRGDPGETILFTQVYRGERRFTEKTLRVLGFGFCVSLLFYGKKESELLNDKVRSGSAFCQRGDEP